MVWLFGQSPTINALASNSGQAGNIRAGRRDAGAPSSPVIGGRDIGRPEIDPCHIHEQEGDDDADRLRHAMARRCPPSLDATCNTVKRPHRIGVCAGFPQAENTTDAIRGMSKRSFLKPKARIQSEEIQAGNLWSRTA
jgi:hypothetical protein